MSNEKDTCHGCGCVCPCECEDCISCSCGPNFTQGSMTSVTTQTVTTSETINSMDYATGWTYSVSGSGVQLEEGSTNVAPDVTTTQTNTVDGVTSTWTGLNLSTKNKPNWVQSEAGGAFQFTEHYSGPGLQTHTIIQREKPPSKASQNQQVYSQTDCYHCTFYMCACVCNRCGRCFCYSKSSREFFRLQ